MTQCENFARINFIMSMNKYFASHVIIWFSTANARWGEARIDDDGMAVWMFRGRLAEEWQPLADLHTGWRSRRVGWRQTRWWVTTRWRERPWLCNCSRDPGWSAGCWDWESLEDEVDFSLELGIYELGIFAFLYYYIIMNQIIF